MQVDAEIQNEAHAATFRPAFSRGLNFLSKARMPMKLLAFAAMIGMATFASAQAIAPADNGDKADPQFRALFLSWKKLDSIQQGTIAIPCTRPINQISFSSGFGIRSDPFRGSAAMHAGVDLPGPIGTPIYATADGIVGYSAWMNGYGNLVEIEHGKGIETRYGHLSRILVKSGQPVKRGQLIALMGSTGRSTGSHLHYEVRLDGRAVNPIPFLQASDYLTAMQKSQTTQVAMGGPDE